MDANSKALVGAWSRAKERLAKIKEEEAELRAKVIREFFPNKQPLDKGTFRAPLVNGYQIKMEAKVNVKIDEAALPAVLKTLKENNHPDIYFTYKPKFESKPYAKADKELTELLNEALIFTEGSASLTIEAPAKKDIENEL